MSATVVVRDLRKRYGDVEAAAGVNLDVQRGEIFGLIGPNGAGKTTTVECIIGLREPDAGTIEVCGVDARRHPRDVRQKIGAALQTNALQDKITPREALALFGSFYRHAVPAGTLLNRFDLAEKADAAFDTLSGGQRQRLALALAFVNQPELIFLDEPTAGLDPHSRRELHDQIAQMKHDERAVLLTTHYLDEAETLCDRIAIIDRGRIVATGTPSELTSRSTAMHTVSLSAAQPLAPDLLATLPDVGDITCSGATARFRTADAGRTVAALLQLLAAHQIDLTELHVQKATLEDVFIELTDAQ